MIKNYIIIDDDAFNNAMCEMILKNTLGKVTVTTFESPEEGLEYISSAFRKNSEETILLLDINMPTITAWEFLEQYETFQAEIQERIQIFILSSSVDKRDKDAAAAFKSIKGFISKPLDKTMVYSMSGAQQAEIKL